MLERVPIPPIHCRYVCFVCTNDLSDLRGYALCSFACIFPFSSFCFADRMQNRTNVSENFAQKFTLFRYVKFRWTLHLLLVLVRDWRNWNLSFSLSVSDGVITYDTLAHTNDERHTTSEQYIQSVFFIHFMHVCIDRKPQRARARMLKANDDWAQ